MKKEKGLVFFQLGLGIVAVVTTTVTAPNWLEWGHLLTWTQSWGGVGPIYTNVAVVLLILFSFQSALARSWIRPDPFFFVTLDFGLVVGSLLAFGPPTALALAVFSMIIRLCPPRRHTVSFPTLIENVGNRLLRVLAFVWAFTLLGGTFPLRYLSTGTALALLGGSAAMIATNQILFLPSDWIMGHLKANTYLRGIILFDFPLNLLLAILGVLFSLLAWQTSPVAPLLVGVLLLGAAQLLLISHQATERASRRIGIMQRLNQCMADWLQARTMGALVRRLSAHAESLLGADWLYLALVEPDSDLMQIFLSRSGVRLRRWRQKVEHEALVREMLNLAATTPGEDTLYQIFARVSGFSEDLKVLKPTRSMELIQEGGRPVGGIALIWSEEKTSSPVEKPFTRAFLKQAALATQNLRLLERATRDPLTGAVSRAHCMQLLREHTYFLREDGIPLTLVMMDLDHFKEVNDVHGHMVGDNALIAVCDRWRAQLPPQSTLARWGGDEFLLILPDMTRSDAVDLVSKLQKALHEHPLSVGNGLTLPLDSSAGVYEVSKEISTHPEEAVEQADRLLYIAKEMGRGRVVADS